MRKRVALYGGSLRAEPRSTAGSRSTRRRRSRPRRRSRDPSAAVDDQALVCGGLHSILSGQDDIEVVGDASDGVEAIELTLTSYSWIQAVVFACECGLVRPVDSVRR